MRHALLVLSLFGLASCSKASGLRRLGGRFGISSFGGLAGGGKGALIGGGVGAAGGAAVGAATTPQPTYRRYSSGGGYSAY